MPQLDVNTFVPQLVWLVIVFGYLYVLMSRIALPRIATVLEKALAEARSKAHEIAQATRDTLHEETERQRLAIEARLATKIAEAEKQIAATRDAALQNVRSVAVDVADAIVAQLLGEADRAAAESAVNTELS